MPIQATDCPTYGLLYPAHCPTPCNTHLFFDFLYWKTHVDTLEWAATAINSGGGLIATSSTNDPNWGWDPGFRVGLEHSCGCEGLNLSLIYTWYQSKATDSGTFPEGDTFALFSTQQAIGSGNTDWHLRFQTLDLGVNKPFFLDKQLVLDPRLSLFGAHISDTYDINITGGATTAHNSQKVWYVGPKAGLTTLWCLTHRWKVFGEGAIAFLWANYRVKREDFNSTLLVQNLKNVFSKLTLVPQFRAGVEWKSPICQGKYLLDFQVAWEQQFWLQQNRYFLFNVPTDNTLLANQGNLDLYGLTVRGGIQF